MRKKENIFYIMLGIISIMGFLSIVIDVFTKIDLTKWVHSVILMLMGVGLIVVGEIKSIIKDFEHASPLDLITSTIGVMSIMSGLLSVPIFNLISPAFDGLKGIVSVLAIFLISLQIIDVIKNKNI